MTTILAAIAAVEFIIIMFLFYCFQRVFEAAKNDEPVEPIEWEGWK